MALEVLHQQAATHENEQFRRVVKIIDTVFRKHNYDGILIGNPYNENYRRFRADAILLFNHGVVIIDFKDYAGQLNIPRGDDEFKRCHWSVEKALDHQTIEVKAGAHFLNPFLQLASYRTAFKEIVEHNPILKQKINPSRVCITNIFSGPLTLSNKIPGRFPYYKIAEESKIGALLYDLNNDNAFDEEISKTIKSIFPSDEYIQDYSSNIGLIRKQDIKVGEEAKSTINAFMQADGNDILVLTSMDVEKRDNWAKYIFSIADNYGIPEVHGLCHSNRISRRLSLRGIEASSLYSFIYKGNETSEDEGDEKTIQVIPIHSDTWLDERALLIVYDAHLVSRSLSQTDLLRFGTGRLLEDFIAFANPASKRKIVFIGDPYMLSFGSSDDSAINLANLQTICEDRTIHYYHQPAYDSQESCKESLKYSLAKSIDAQVFNNLNYSFDDGTIVEIEKDAITNKLKEWFMSPLQQEPKQSVLFFMKSDCWQTNLWIKHYCLNNGNKLEAGDLLIANNNIYIPDETGFGCPQRVLNGMYFTVKDVLEKHSETISIKGESSPVLLSFTKISVKCLSQKGQYAEIWVLDNYWDSPDDLNKKEQIAVNIFIDRRVAAQKESSPFVTTEFYRELKDDANYKALSDNEKGAIENIIQNRRKRKENRENVETTKTARSLLKQYYDMYESDIQRSSRKKDPLINILYAKYAWAITVQKAVGSEFDNVILKGFRTENDGICNESYFRWLYSGLSVAARTFYIAQPQYVHPFINCTVSETNSGVNQPKQLLIYDGYKVPSRFSEMVALNNVNASAAVCELAKLIEPNGYILEEVKPCNDYLTKAVFSVPQGIKKKLVIDIHNKGAKDSYGISAIRMEPNELVDATCIEQGIDTVFSQAVSCNKPVETPDYILEVVKAFGEQMKKRGFKLEVVSCKDYQIVCKVTSDNGNAMLRLWYGTNLESHSKGFVNKIEVFDTTDTTIANEVREMINQQDNNSNSKNGKV
ncbi:MAG: hypothetical protein IJ355_02390 [Prevotella sp.]|nr:hypothetical protein [Prevotella sp.]